MKRCFLLLSPSTPIHVATATSRKWNKVGDKTLIAMSDFFIRQSDPWQEEAWALMLACTHLTFQVLTKRPGYMAAWAQTHPWPAHIWAGTSVESAKYLPRLDVLARVPAKIRFASFEPLLGPLNIKSWLYRCVCREKPCTCKGLTIQWAIIGAESGPGARPCDVAWIRDIVTQCQAAGVAVFVKQDSGRLPGSQGRIPDELWLKEFPNG